MPPRPVLALLCLSTALLTGCSAGTEQATQDDPVVRAPSAAASTTPPSAAAGPAASPSSPAVRVIPASYRGGEVVVDSSRVQTRVGERIVLRISSDVAEQVHVHGYDVYADVPAGGSVDVPLTTTLPGSFEVELHEVGRPLLQLRTS